MKLVYKEDVCQLQQSEGQRNFADMSKTLGQLCAFTDCHMTCSQPVIVEACGSDEPMTLIRGLFGETMGAFAHYTLITL